MVGPITIGSGEIQKERKGDRETGCKGLEIIKKRVHELYRFTRKGVKRIEKLVEQDGKLLNLQFNFVLQLNALTINVVIVSI